MAGIVNIRRDVDDKFYRYRMPVLLTKVEGKGNGIKTVLPNVQDVARALSRPPMYPTKYFGAELGAQTMYDAKADRYIVNGAHQSERLRELLDGFIDKYVLCGSCKNPETDLIVTKDEMIIRDCKACGAHTNVDMRNRLSSYIIKNPPKKSRKSKKENGDANGKNGDGDASPDGEEGSDDELTKRINAEAAELPPIEKSSLGDDWSADTSPEAVKERTALLEKFKSSLVLAGGGDDEEDEADTDSPYYHLKTWLIENRDDEDITSVDLYKKMQELGIEKKHKAMLTIGEYLFSEENAPVVPESKAVKRWTPAIKKLILAMKDTDKAQKSLLGGLERYVGRDHPDLIPSVPKILMAWYLEDWLEEETVTQWGTHVSKKYVDKDTSKKVRLAAKPFLKWLEEADDDEEEEDDTDEE
ncbi:hypothetical protein CALCODRAFT_494891 [Calocera cornea HHB12733]|uniref:W2 domain-containing protein n=1 Tax=Calocera cornea HHB12733 TaxID=1353952 RepID=A0A165GS57_9BASI|nr:hypothetical protein CALCODRAFT_494891 [Calocera cornea HHB12733]